MHDIIIRCLDGEKIMRAYIFAVQKEIRGLAIKKVPRLSWFACAKSDNMHNHMHFKHCTKESLNKQSYKTEETIHFMGELSFGVIITCAV